MNAKIVINTDDSSPLSRRVVIGAAVAERFGYSTAYVHLLRHQFTTGKIDFSEPVTEGKAARYRVTAETRRKIRSWREKELSSGEIAQLLSDPHYGDESVLQEHWAGARGKRMKGALTLFAQDAASKLVLYTAADILKEEANEQVLNVLSFWQKVQKGVASTFVFDSKFTTYEHLSLLNRQGIRFITLRRRGKKLIGNLDELKPWEKIHIPHDKRKYPDPLIHQSFTTLKDYEGQLRQIILRGNGREEPAFIITNDLTAPAERIVSDYARRWRVENVISEAVKFFNLNALSSPILVKVHFDVLMTMIADTLYSMLAQKLRGFEQCDAQKIYRHFIRGKADVNITSGEVQVTYPRRAHNPILRDVPWQRMPQTISWLDGAKLNLMFQ